MKQKKSNKNLSNKLALRKQKHATIVVHQKKNQVYVPGVDQYGTCQKNDWLKHKQECKPV
jgi:hypothetical protein